VVNCATVAQRVTVAGWGWYRWIEKSRAVRMVPHTIGVGTVLMVFGYLEKIGWKFCKRKEKLVSRGVWYYGHSTGGSGWVGVVPLDRGDRGGSNDVKYDVCR
jgi:hypothetical protein